MIILIQRCSNWNGCTNKLHAIVCLFGAGDHQVARTEMPKSALVANGTVSAEPAAPVYLMP